jgi:hypothetical protein
VLFSQQTLFSLNSRKLRTRFSLSGKNPGFLANTFSTSQIIDEVKKVKLPFHRGFSDSDRVTKKMDKVELRTNRKSTHPKFPRKRTRPWGQSKIQNRMTNDP